MAAGRKTGGRKAGTPNKATASVRAVAGAYTQQAIDTLAKIMQDEAEPAIARVRAAAELLDRAHGRPHQSADVDVRGLATGPRIIEVVAGPIDPATAAPTYRPSVLVQTTPGA